MKENPAAGPKTRTHLCIFCGKRADSLEHVFFPDWAAEEIRKAGRPMRTAWEGHNVYPEEPRARVVCRKCNSEWMSQIEMEAKPVIVRLRVGSGVISPDDAYRLAVWLTKTSMVYESVVGPESGSVYFTQEQRTDLRLVRLKNRLVAAGTLPRMRLFVGRYDGQSTGVILGQTIRITRFGEHVRRGYVVTAMLFGVVMQAMFPPPDLPEEAYLRIGDEWPGYIHEIWPMARDQRWPPKEAMTDAGSDLDRFTARFSTEPEDRQRQQPDTVRRRAAREMGLDES